MESVDTPTKLPTVLNGKVVASHSGIGGKEWLGDQTVWLNQGDYVVRDPEGNLWLVNLMPLGHFQYKIAFR